MMTSMDPEMSKMMDYYGYHFNELMKVLTDEGEVQQFILTLDSSHNEGYTVMGWY